MHSKGTIVISIGKPQQQDHKEMDVKDKHYACHILSLEFHVSKAGNHFLITFPIISSD